MRRLVWFKFKRTCLVVDMGVTLFGYGPQFFFMIWPKPVLSRFTVTLRDVHIDDARLSTSFRLV